MLECQRDRFNLPQGLSYLNCAYMAPLSRQVHRAAHEALERLVNPSQLTTQDFFEDADTTRQLFARLIGTRDHQRIAIVPAVSYALAAVAKNVELSSHQNVVVVHNQFPSSVYTWRRVCRSSKAELRTVTPPDPGRDQGAEWSQRVLDAIDTRTGVVCVPELHWTDGTRFDVEQIGARARGCGAVFVIDGTQSVGAVPFDITRAQPDAVVCAGYKWLMGPYALGLAYYGPRFDDGIPLEENWIARRGSDDFAHLVNYEDAYRPGAVRYDVGERSSFILLPMLKTALRQVLDWGPEAIQDYCRLLTTDALTALRNLGCQVQTDEWRRHHLFGIGVPDHVELPVLARRLDAARVSVSVRGSSIRVAPHVYNSLEDLQALVDAVRTTVDRPTTSA